MRWRVHISREDIDKGIRGEPIGCPMALALRRSFPRRPQVAVQEVIILGQKVALPPEAQEFNRRHDAGFHVAPISFELDLGGMPAWMQAVWASRE